jgi:hypothetical protein
MFDNDPKYQKLKAIREGGYDGPLDQDLNRVPPTDPRALAADVLRRTGA